MKTAPRLGILVIFPQTCLIDNGILMLKLLLCLLSLKFLSRGIGIQSLNAEVLVLCCLLLCCTLSLQGLADFSNIKNCDQILCLLLKLMWLYHFAVLYQLIWEARPLGKFLALLFLQLSPSIF